MILDSLYAYDCNWYGQDTLLLTRDSLLGKPKVILDDMDIDPPGEPSYRFSRINSDGYGFVIK